MRRRRRHPRRLPAGRVRAARPQRPRAPPSTARSPASATEGRHALRARATTSTTSAGPASLADTAPAVAPTQVADLAAGALGALVEILAALLERERTGKGRRITISMTHGSHRLVAHRLGGDPRPEAAHGRAAVLSHLRDGRRALSHGRRARAEVLAAAVRAHRAARPRRAPLRPFGGRGAEQRVRHAAARRVARALRRRGRLRRPRLHARGSRRRVRPSGRRPAARSFYRVRPH